MIAMRGSEHVMGEERQTVKTSCPRDQVMLAVVAGCSRM